MSKTCRVGIIGTGGISRAHSKGYIACEYTEIVAATDISEEQLKQYGGEFSVTSLYTDYMEMLKKENLDIVSVCTWHKTHCEIVVNVAPHVKGIMCEKPMALNLREADVMVKLAIRQTQNWQSGIRDGLRQDILRDANSYNRGR